MVDTGQNLENNFSIYLCFENETERLVGLGGMQSNGKCYSVSID